MAIVGNRHNYDNRKNLGKTEVTERTGLPARLCAGKSKNPVCVATIGIDPANIFQIPAQKESSGSLSIQTFSPQLTSTSLRQGVCVACLLAVLVIAFFHENVLELRPAVPFDLLYTVEPWKSEGVNTPAQPHNPELFDQIVTFYPWRTLIADEMKHGRIPLWNPLSFSGSPLLANGQSGVFHPLKLVSLLFTPALASIFLCLMRVFAAGIFTFAFLKQLGLRRDVSFFGAVVFSFSRNFIAWLNFPAGDAAVMLPGLFWACERLLRSGSLADFIWGALFVGIQLLAGQPQTSLVSAFAISIYVLLRLSADNARRHPKAKILLLYSAMWLLGALLAAVQILPMLEYMKESAAVAFRSQFNLKVYPWYEIISLIVPDFFGTPYDGNYWGFANLVGTACYIGVAPFILALMSLRSVARHAIPRCFWIITITSLGIVYKLPLLKKISSLPLFNATDTNKFLVVIAFSLSVCSAIALEQILRADLTKAAFKTSLVCAAVAAVAGGVYLQFRDFVTALHLEAYEKKNFAILAILLVATFMIVWAHATLRIRKPVICAALIALAYIDSFMFGHSYNAAPLKSQIPPAPPAIVKLQDDLKNYRVLGIHSVLLPNTSMLYGVADIRGYDALTPGRYFNFLSKILPDYADFLRTLDLSGNPEITRSTLFTREIRRMFSGESGEELRTTLQRAFYWNTDLDDLVTSQALDAFSVGFVVAPKDVQALPRSDLQLIASEGASVFRNPGALPRTYLRGDFTITDDSSALQFVSQPEFNFHRQLLVSGVPDRASVEEVFKRADSAARQDTARILREDPSHVEIVAETDGPRFLVLTDLYFPGWRAYLDGNPVAIRAANYLFRAVLLPAAGHHVVRFEYKPVSFMAGMICSGGALICILILVCLKMS